MKEKFIKSTIILVIGGFITKILGMVIKIVATRLIGIEGIGLYMLILPTFNLFITLCTLSFPIAISKVIAEGKSRSKNVVLSLIPVSLIINIILIGLIILIAPFLANNLLHDERLYYPIIAIGTTLPFISISSIARGYFFGKEKMFPHTLSNVFEQVVRLILFIILLPVLLEKSLVWAVTAMVAVNIISELTSIVILFIYLPKKFEINKSNFKMDKTNLKNIFSVSIPTTLGRLIGSIGYFLEPIAITFFLLKFGYSNNFILTEYGILSGYVMPLLLMPSFLSLAIGSALLPVISKSYANKNIKYVNKKINQATFISFVIGLLATITLMIFPEFFLNIIYHTTEGVNYLKTMAPFFLIYYIQAPLATALQAINKSKSVMLANLYGIIIKLILISILSILKIGMYPLVIATCFNIVLITLLHYIDLKKALKNN